MKAPKSALTTWPADFALDDDLTTYAKSCGLDPKETWEDFRIYHQSHGSMFSRWRVAFQGWCRKAAQFKAGRESAVKESVNNFVNRPPRSKYLKELEAAQMAEAAQTPEQRAANIKYFKEELAKLVRKW